MKIAILGSGGREHAICLSVKKSKNVNEIYCIPGNAGTAQIAKNLDIDPNDFTISTEFDNTTETKPVDEEED